MQRRRSKLRQVNLSGKSTFTGRNSGESPHWTAKGETLVTLKVALRQRGQRHKDDLIIFVFSVFFIC